MRMPLLAAALFCFWLVLSGHWDAWLVLSGLCLSVLTAVFCQAKGLVDAEGFPYGTLFRNALYWPWLIWQIALSALNVTKIILDPRLPITPSLVRVRALQKSPLGMTIYANSITLTPGTISVEICENEHLIWVHAIEKAGAEGFADDEMNRRVAWVDEGQGLMFSAGIVAVLIGLVLAVLRALMGPSAFDRLLAVNTIGTFAILLLALLGFLTGRPEFLDIALVYALLNMIGVLAVLKFFRYGGLGYGLDEDEDKS